jgi:hypothetical protein
MKIWYPDTAGTVLEEAVRRILGTEATPAVIDKMLRH